jgi:hypothetical protein
MTALYISMAVEAEHVVRRPRPADAIGAALRGVFPCPPLPEEMTRLIRRLDRQC